MAAWVAATAPRCSHGQTPLSNVLCRGGDRKQRDGSGRASTRQVSSGAGRTQTHQVVPGLCSPSTLLCSVVYTHCSDAWRRCDAPERPRRVAPARSFIIIFFFFCPRASRPLVVLTELSWFTGQGTRTAQLRRHHKDPARPVSESTDMGTAQFMGKDRSYFLHNKKN